MSKLKSDDFFVTEKEELTQSSQMLHSDGYYRHFLHSNLRKKMYEKMDQFCMSVKAVQSFELDNN